MIDIIEMQGVKCDVKGSTDECRRASPEIYEPYGFSTTCLKWDYRETKLYGLAEAHL